MLPSSARIVLTGSDPAGYWEGAPDLAIEVVSPRDTVYEVEEKVDDWLNLGAGW